LLSEKKLSGYDITKRMEGEIGYFWYASHSQIYTELRKMEDEGYVEHSVVHQEDNPDKKLYEITEEGEDALLDWLKRFSFRDRKLKSELLLKIYMLDKIPEEDALELIYEYRGEYKKRLERFKEIEDRHFGEEKLKDKRYAYKYMALLNGIYYYEYAISWCDRVIKTIEKFLHSEG
jgi:DNA-binding PadR family transcriptional regulator